MCFATLYLQCIWYIRVLWMLGNLFYFIFSKYQYQIFADHTICLPRHTAHCVTFDFWFLVWLSVF